MTKDPGRRFRKWARRLFVVHLRTDSFLQILLFCFLELNPDTSHSPHKKQGGYTYAGMNGGSRTSSSGEAFASRLRTVGRGANDFDTGGALSDPD